MDSIDCHLKDTCMKPQLNASDQNFQQFIKLTLLPCGHIYHEYCLQHYDYIKNQININVESIINTSKKKEKSVILPIFIKLINHKQ